MSDRDRKLAEMMGMCWHEIPFTYPVSNGWEHPCKKCGLLVCIDCNPDFSTPEWRARLMDWAVEQEWFKEFVYWTQDRVEKIELAAIYVYLWRNLPDLLFEYHREGR